MWHGKVRHELPVLRQSHNEASREPGKLQKKIRALFLSLPSDESLMRDVSAPLPAL